MLPPFLSYTQCILINGKNDTLYCPKFLLHTLTKNIIRQHSNTKQLGEIPIGQFARVVVHILLGVEAVMLIILVVIESLNQ